MGPIPRSMLRKGRYSHRFYTRSGVVYERSQRTVCTENHHKAYFTIINFPVQILAFILLSVVLL